MSDDVATTTHHELVLAGRHLEVPAPLRREVVVLAYSCSSSLLHRDCSCKPRPVPRSGRTRPPASSGRRSARRAPPPAAAGRRPSRSRSRPSGRPRTARRRSTRPARSWSSSSCASMTLLWRPGGVVVAASGVYHHCAGPQHAATPPCTIAVHSRSWVSPSHAPTLAPLRRKKRKGLGLTPPTRRWRSAGTRSGPRRGRRPPE